VAKDIIFAEAFYRSKTKRCRVLLSDNAFADAKCYY